MATTVANYNPENNEECFSIGGTRRVSAIIYCRIPSLLANAARVGSSAQHSPLIIIEGRTVRDSCSAAHHGIADGMLVTRARRLCPHVLAIPIEQVNPSVARDYSRVLLNALADLSPVVEPDPQLDVAYSDLSAAGGLNTNGALLAVSDLRSYLRKALPGIREPLIAVGPSRLAARALAECGGLSPERLPDCNARWLWTEDPAVTARLLRLGLTTFGAVATLPESAIIYQFGPKVGPILWRRAHGQDLTPVRALYPEPRAEAMLDLAQEPVTNAEQLQEVLRRLICRVADDLIKRGRHARRVLLWIAQENNAAVHQAEWIVPAPVQSEHELRIATRNLLLRFAITSPIIGVRLAAEDLDLPLAATGGLFDQHAQGDRRNIAAARRLLTTRYGPGALRSGSEIVIERRDRRRALLREARRA